jgi:hypothetical protein
MLFITLAKDEHTRSFEISAQPEDGWVAFESEDGRVEQEHLLSDWHKVERMASRFRRDANTLVDAGWVEVDHSDWNHVGARLSHHVSVLREVVR